MSFQGETGLPGPQGPPGISGTLVGTTLAHGEIRNYCLKKILKRNYFGLVLQPAFLHKPLFPHSKGPGDLEKKKLAS